MANFPTSLDSLTNPTANDTLAAVPHDTQHGTANDILEALEAKLGIGASTPTAGSVLVGTATGTSEWVTPIFDAVAGYGAAGDGVTDDTSAIRSCYQAAAAASASSGAPVVVYLRPGCSFLLTSRIIIEGAIAGITTVGYGARLIISADVGSAIPALHFGYDVASSLTGLAYDVTLGRIATTTATVDVSRSSRTVTVASTTGMSAGDAVTIASSGEYFLGITGDSGYSVRNKSEMNIIRKVVSSTELTLDHRPEDDYDVDAYTVTVSAYNRIRNIHFVGLTLVGPGEGGQHGGSQWGPEAIRIEWCENFSFTQGRAQNFSYAPMRTIQCWGVRITNNHFIGEDVADPTNDPGTNIWFYGPSHHGSMHTVFANNVCRNVRRPEDHTPLGSCTISRHIVQSNNTVTGCESGMGAHMCEHVVNEGNELVDCNNGHYYRGKNITIRGGRVSIRGTGSSACVATFGSFPGGAYSEDPDLGDIIVDGVYGDSAGGFIKINNSVTSLTVRNCVTSPRLTQAAVYFIQAKRVKNVTVQGNYFKIGYRAGNGIHCFYLWNHTDNPTTVIDGIRIEDNHLGDGRIGVLIDGSNDITAPAKNIVVRNNHFPAESATAVNGQQNAIRLGVSGWYGTNIVLGPNEIWSSPSSRAVDLDPSTGAADMHRYYEMPYLDAARKVVGTATSSALAGSSWSTVATKTTVTKGMRFDNSDADAAEYSGWIVTVAGTVGTITSATTGTISSGTTSLVINANDDYRCFPGAYITIAGAGAASANLSTRVTAVSGTTVTIANAASTSVTDAAISYTNPTLKGVGLIES